MLPQEIIRKKRDNNELSYEELKEFFLSSDTSDYQLSAMLMSIYFRGMSDKEISDLTDIMACSGKRFSWKEPLRVVDKHSTGGIGDKTSILILPLCLLEDVFVPMMCGRGLAHTGGTVDKLESIPNINLGLSFNEAQDSLYSVGGFFMGQTSQIAPLDKKLYALRDVTATVESIPLIVASILSKKIVEGISYLVMDVKYGSGAFMQDKDKALALAEKLVSVSALNKVKTTCFLTSMNNCLGRTAGNSLELKECIEVMEGNYKDCSDLMELSVELASSMVNSVYPNRKLSEIKESMLNNLNSGKVLEKFKSIVKNQGGDLSVIEDKNLLDKYDKIDVYPKKAGFISKIDVKNLGILVVELGGGRRKVTDNIDCFVGLSNIKKVSEYVDNNVPLLTISYKDKSNLNEIIKLAQSCFETTQEKIEVEPLIWRKID